MQEQKNTIPRGMQFSLFVMALAWAAVASVISARSAHGIAVRFHVLVFELLLDRAFFVFLVVTGFGALDWIATRGRFASETLPLPRRPGWRREWGIGAAVGWALSLAAALPLLLTGNLHARLSWPSGTTQAFVAALGSLLAATLAQELIFRGYPFRRLIATIGPSWAAVLMSALFAVVVLQANPPRSLLVPLINLSLFGLLLAMAWLRTHALWLGWGLHFAYRAVAAIVLGLPIAGHGEFGSPTDMYASGPRWLTGGAFGLDAAWFTFIVLLVGIAVLFRVTRDYAWNYTHPPIVPAGYEVVVAPPAAHVAMEKAAAPPPLVQIMPSTPQGMSIHPAGEPPQ